MGIRPSVERIFKISSKVSSLSKQNRQRVTNIISYKRKKRSYSLKHTDAIEHHGSLEDSEKPPVDVQPRRLHASLAAHSNAEAKHQQQQLLLRQ